MSQFGTSFDDVSVLDSFGEPADPVYPPRGWFALPALALLISVGLFFPASKLFNWFGWGIGEIGTIVGVLVYRHIDLRRSASPSYVPKETWNYFAVALIVVGVAIGCLHVWFALRSTYVR